MKNKTFVRVSFDHVFRNDAIGPIDGVGTKWKIAILNYGDGDAFNNLMVDLKLEAVKIPVQRMFCTIYQNVHPR